MRYFLDTEFIERGPDYPVSLVSIGIVSEDGRELYAVSLDFDPDPANDWVKQNVFPHLEGEFRAPLREIATKVQLFTFGDPKPEFWGYYSAYDWVVFCQIFGTMMDLPKGYPMYCNDLKQLAKSLGNPELPKQGKNEHNALKDARWNKKAYEFLQLAKEPRA